MLEATTSSQVDYLARFAGADAAHDAGEEVLAHRSVSLYGLSLRMASNSRSCCVLVLVALWTFVAPYKLSDVWFQPLNRRGSSCAFAHDRAALGALQNGAPHQRQPFADMPARLPTKGAWPSGKVIQRRSVEELVGHPCRTCRPPMPWTEAGQAFLAQQQTSTL